MARGSSRYLEGSITARVASASARYRWYVIAAWLALVAVAGSLAFDIGDVLTADDAVVSNAESEQAETLLVERLRGPEAPQEFIVVRSATGTVDDAAFVEVTSDLLARIRTLEGTVVAATSYYETGYEGFVSADRRTTLIPVTLAGEVGDAEATSGPLVSVVERFEAPAGFEALVAGQGSIGRTFTETSERDLRRGEGIGVPIALLILVAVFGAAVAAGIPLIVALVAVVTALGVAFVVGQGFELSFFVVNMITVVGLAVGIDYSLFIVQRYREERLRGFTVEAAIARAGATANRAVLFSGGAVVIGLLGLLLVPSNVYQSLGLGAISVAVVAVLAALTLLPALLSVLGDRVDALRIPFLPRLRLHERTTAGAWNFIVRLVMRQPLVSLSVSCCLLIAAAVPAFTLQSGISGVSTLPSGNEQRRAFEILQEDFSAGLVSPVEVVVDTPDVSSPAVIAAISTLTGLIEDDAVFDSVSLTTNETGDLALISALLTTDPRSPEAYDAVRRLRGDYIPEAFAGTEANVLVTGLTAEEVDLIDVITLYTPIVFSVVLGLSFILLLLVFRSIVVPVKAIIMNLLSVGAAYGLLVLVFQHGIGNEIFGFQQTRTIEAWLPLFLFAIMFGLSMDYHVFLLSRIRERYGLTGSNRESVAFGVRSTGSIITGAALIMVAVFMGMALGDLAPLQQAGFGLGVAVIIDATIIRSVIVPASMAVLGRFNWYLPRWLEWLPELRIEGDLRSDGEGVK